MPDALTVAARANHVLVGVLILAGLAFAAIGAAQNDTFYLRLATEALIFGGLALSVDILLGYTGLLSLGQALYFGLGAYLSALVLKAVPSFWLALAAGLGAGLVLGLVGGIIAIRVRGVYFALITFGLAQVVAKVVYNTRALGASDGLLGVPYIDIDLGVASVSSASPAGFFLVMLAVIIDLYAVFGLHPRHAVRPLADCAARQRPARALLGYRTASLRLTHSCSRRSSRPSRARSIRCCAASCPGAAVLLDLGNAVITVLLGGVGTLIGALYGSVLLTVLRFVLGTWTEHPLMIIGLPVHRRRDLPAPRADGAGAPGGRAPARAQGAAMTAPVLEARDLSISFSRLRAVDGVSFAAARDRITTIIGPNGAGKSTLFDLISARCGRSPAPSSSRVFECTGAPPYRMLAAGVARSFQIADLLFDLPMPRPAAGGAGAGAPRENTDGRSHGAASPAPVWPSCWSVSASPARPPPCGPPQGRPCRRGRTAPAARLLGRRRCGSVRSAAVFSRRLQHLRRQPQVLGHRPSNAVGYLERAPPPPPACDTAARRCIRRPRRRGAGLRPQRAGHQIEQGRLAAFRR